MPRGRKERNKMEHAKQKHPMGVAMQVSCGEETGSTKSSGQSLQEAFGKFRKNRQRAIRQSKQIDKNALKARADPVLMDKLRMKFVERCKHYFGIPYAKKYQDPETPEFHSPLFLDCCGLIRKVLRDLKEDFGFEVGPWNQAYMFDTLPKDIQSTENMRPGDLVFISGIYHNKKSKKQRHNMVHVEVWAGDGEKTIGARWQKGKVQYHDSYKFTAKSYHSMQYHFKSINTWLMGICQSHCHEHSWKMSKYKPGKKSIFAADQSGEMEDQDAEPEEENDNDNADENSGNGRQTVDYKLGSKNGGDVDSSSMRHQLLVNERTDSSKEHEHVIKSMSRRSGESSGSTGANVSSQSDSIQFSSNGSIKSDRNLCSHRTFSDLEECVNWLVTSVKSDVENEMANTGDAADSKLQNPWQCCTETLCTDTEEETVMDNLYNKELESASFSELGKNCFCPQCCPVEMHCIHQETAVNTSSNQGRDETGTLEDDKELSSSLECFDFVFVDEELCQDAVDKGIIQCPNNSNTNGRSKSRRSVSPSKATRNGKGDRSSGPSGDGGGGNEENNKKDAPHRNTRDGTRSVNHLSTRQPSFFIGGGNGNWMIEATLVSLGWRKLEDKLDESFKLKWVECKSQINYNSFREGEQMANHISNINLLTTKLGLMCSLQEYERVKEKVGKAGSKLRLPLNEFVPETHRLMGESEKLKFVNEVYKDGETWICKPTGMNQGKGIYLVSSREQLTEKLNINGREDSGVRRSPVRPPQGRIIQRYVLNPLLLNGYKFDIRVYMLIASTTPYVVLYHPGYVRLSCVPFTPYTQDEEGLHAHLTNQYVQKKHPMYSSMKEETVWSFDRLQSYIDETYTEAKGLPDNWVYTTFTKRMQQIMTTCFHSVRTKLHRRTGTFDLLGFDFLIDDDFKVWLLEVNINPALHTNCQVLMDMLPGVVDETLKLVIEISDKTKRKRPVFPLENLNGFHVLYNGEGK